MATTGPHALDRPAQPYVGTRATVTLDAMGRIADRIPGLMAWLAERHVTPTGPPFLRYLTIDMARALVVEAGVPIAVPVHVTDEVFAATLPAGRYIVTTHRGHPDGLVRATAELLAWADARGLRWDVQDTPDGQAWGCRLEVFRTDPREVPSMDDWETDLVFRLADRAV
jgi:RNA polymerase sigma-70 factor (ECF subfamily)